MKKTLEPTDLSDVELFESYDLLGWAGKPRLSRARYVFEQLDDLELLDRYYAYWRDMDEFMVLQDPDGRYVCVKCSKRGNDVHQHRLKQRLDWLRTTYPDVEFFSEKDFKTDSKVTTRALWITLTHDHKIEPTRAEAWRNVGHHWNRFMSALRNRYGQVSILKVWDAFNTDGFPHPHAILLFHDHEFQVFPHYSQEGALDFRIHEKHEISELWHSFVDVKAIHSTRALLTYVSKHQLSKLDGGSHPRLLALLWLHGKRSFSVSGDFREKISDLIRCLHNSNPSQNVLLFKKEAYSSNVDHTLSLWVGEGGRGGDRLRGSPPSSEVKEKPPWRFVGIFRRTFLEDLEGKPLIGWAQRLEVFGPADEISPYEYELAKKVFDQH